MRGHQSRSDYTSYCRSLRQHTLRRNWYSLTAIDDLSTVKSRSGYVLIYTGWPIIWDSKLHTIIFLSSTDEYYVSLSPLIRYFIPLMVLIKEMKTFVFEVFSEEPIMYCKGFEDNSRSIELAILPKMHPHTKHINVLFHHFCECIRKWLTHIQKVSTNDQCTDAWTKPSIQNKFLKHCIIFLVSNL